MHMNTRRKKAFIPLVAILAITVMGFVVMLLWNALLPELFNAPVITFWQAAGLLILCRILFGGFGKGGGRREHYDREHRDHWMHPLRESWSKMTPEQQEKFREKWKKRWGKDFEFDPSEEHPGGWNDPCC